MTYDDIEELPAAMRNSLPKEAMELYLAAFNQALTRSIPARDRTRGTVQGLAHSEAWRALREKYHKRDGEWVRDYL